MIGFSGWSPACSRVASQSMVSPASAGLIVASTSPARSLTGSCSPGLDLVTQDPLGVGVRLAADVDAGDRDAARHLTVAEQQVDAVDHDERAEHRGRDQPDLAKSLALAAGLLAGCSAWIRTVGSSPGVRVIGVSTSVSSACDSGHLCSTTCLP